MTKIVRDEGYLATLKVLVPKAAQGEELAVSSVRSVLEQALMDRSEFDSLAEAEEVGSLDLRLTPELRARIESLASEDSSPN